MLCACCLVLFALNSRRAFVSLVCHSRSIPRFPTPFVGLPLGTALSSKGHKGALPTPQLPAKPNSIHPEGKTNATPNNNEGLLRMVEYLELEGSHQDSWLHTAASKTQTHPAPHRAIHRSIPTPILCPIPSQVGHSIDFILFYFIFF